MYMCTDVACKVIMAFDIQCGAKLCVIHFQAHASTHTCTVHTQLIIVRSFSMKVIPNADEKIFARAFSSFCSAVILSLSRTVAVCSNFVRM